MDPVISLYGASKYPNNMLDFYNGLGNNKIPFEVVFAGPTPPDFELPSNFRYIVTNVKPVQCCEIAARATKGDYIALVADDLTFLGDAPLDKLYELFQKANDKKVVISCQCYIDSSNYVSAHYLFKERYNADVITALAGLMSKEFFLEAGGYDRNFVWAFAIEDLILRMYAAGGHVEMSDIICNEITIKNSHDSLCAKGMPDWVLLSDLWTTAGTIRFMGMPELDPPIISNMREVRLRPLEPFTAEGLLTQSQGNITNWLFD